MFVNPNTRDDGIHPMGALTLEMDSLPMPYGKNPYLEALQKLKQHKRKAS
jgi:hypothetical protein